MSECARERGTPAQRWEGVSCTQALLTVSHQPPGAGQTQPSSLSCCLSSDLRERERERGGECVCVVFTGLKQYWVNSGMWHLITGDIPTRTRHTHTPEIKAHRNDSAALHAYVCTYATSSRTTPWPTSSPSTLWPTSSPTTLWPDSQVTVICRGSDLRGLPLLASLAAWQW